MKNLRKTIHRLYDTWWPPRIRELHAKSVALSQALERRNGYRRDGADDHGEEGRRLVRAAEERRRRDAVTAVLRAHRVDWYRDKPSKKYVCRVVLDWGLFSGMGLDGRAWAAEEVSQRVRRQILRAGFASEIHDVGYPDGPSTGSPVGHDAKQPG